MSTLLDILRSTPQMTRLEVHWLDAQDIQHPKLKREIMQGEIGMYVKDIGYYFRVEREGKFGRYHLVLSHNVVNGYGVRKSTVIPIENIVAVSLQETAKILWQQKEALRAIRRRRPRRVILVE